MLGVSVRSMLEPRKLVVAPPATTVRDAARLMKEVAVGAILVVEDDRLLGIFTERDALFRVMAPRRDPDTTSLAEVMTREPKTVAPDETLGYALTVMYEHGFRHVPVVENGHPIGVISARYALDPDLEEFAVEAERRKAIPRCV